MSRRTFTRTLNGEISNIWRGTGAQAAALGVTTAVFGCTGNMGTAILHQASLHKFTCLLPYRHRAPAQSAIRPHRCFNDGTFGQMFEVDYELDKEFVVKSILEKVDSVYNAVGTFNEPLWYETGMSWYSMEATNVEWPRMLARWARELGIERFVHMSMVGADPNHPSSKLLRLKGMAEQAVLEEFPRATIIRSTDIFGMNDDRYHKYLKWQSHLKVMPVVNGGNRIHQPVFHGDIGEAACRALYLENTAGKIAELGGPVRFTTNDLLRWAADCNGLMHRTVPVPDVVGRLGTRFIERKPFTRAAIIGSRGPFFNQDWFQREFVDNVATPERDPNLLGWEDFGIPQEDLFRMEDKYFHVQQMWAKEHPNDDYLGFL